VRHRGLLLLIAGCSFHTNAAATTDGQVTGDDAITADVPVAVIDGAPDAPAAWDVAHVPPSVTMAFAATSNVSIAAASLDTGGGAIPPTASFLLPADAMLFASPQDGGGPELAILEVGSLTITGSLRVTGSRPLVIIAGTTIVASDIDASAVKSAPGGGGYAPGMGPGAGGGGAVAGNDDAGGGGGGFGTAGGAGQTSGTAAGAAGALYGTADLAQLDGGSGGGAMAPACPGYPAGAGGGAIQLTARTSIEIDGSVRVNGGGGAGGVDCSGTGTSGAGGGAGGAIYLQAPQLLGAGMLLAQGGGGGGATDVATQGLGGDGADGATTIMAASGGTAQGTGVSGESNVGATGGWRDAGPAALIALSGQMSGNGGGGGGSVGRIVIRSASAGAVSASPTAFVVP